MATFNQLLDVQEQICYVQCSFCSTILLVSVPYSSMSMVVTVRCGHCAGLLSVNMLKASFVPLHLLSSIHQDHQNQEEMEASKAIDRHSTTMPMAVSSEEDNNNYDDEDEYEDDNDDIVALEQIVNKPPEKKRRAPSAYNRFIKEEIRRLKARNPNMSHKEAFSTAAKNWAHFPSVQDEENVCHEIANVTNSLEEEAPEVFRSI